jgi:hypothetical protein
MKYHIAPPPKAKASTISKAFFMNVFRVAYDRELCFRAERQGMSSEWRVREKYATGVWGGPDCTSLFCHIFSKGLGSRAAQRDSTIAS